MALALSRTSNEGAPCALCGRSVTAGAESAAGVLYYLTEAAEAVCAECVEAAVVAAIAGVEVGAERYLAGKEKAFWELRQWQPGQHSEDCGCQPCRAGNRIYHAGRFAGEEGIFERQRQERWDKELR